MIDKRTRIEIVTALVGAINPESEPDGRLSQKTITMLFDTAEDIMREEERRMGKYGGGPKPVTP